MSEKHTCEDKRHRPGFGLPMLVCGNTARHEHEGKWYCGIHHPPAAAERQEERRRKAHVKYDARRKAREREKRLRDAEIAERFWHKVIGQCGGPSFQCGCSRCLVADEIIAEMRRAAE